MNPPPPLSDVGGLNGPSRMERVVDRCIVVLFAIDMLLVLPWLAVKFGGWMVSR